MPSCCGSGNACSCKISAGTGIQITGSGSPSDPFVLTASVGFDVESNSTFLLSINGTGTSDDPYTLSINYAPTAKLDDLPDVSVPAPTAGQVLGFDAGSGQWVAVAPTTAPTGAVTHDPSLSGDGSAPNPLSVVAVTNRFVGTFTSGGLGNGVGLSDAGINQLVRHFVDDTARAAANPVPALNTLSMLDTAPGRLAYWDGVQWAPLVGSFDTAYAGAATEFLALSGSYLGSRRTHFISQFTGSTDASGIMDVLTPTDLSGRGGVLSVMFQETGPVGIAFKAVLFPNTDRVSAYVYRISDGTPYASFTFTGIVEAWLY